MFDMGFAELLMIAVIGLIVIGPKRMPEAIRVLGYWLGKLRRTVHSARQEMEQEFGLDEMRRELHNESLLAQLAKERNQIQQSITSASTGANQSASDTVSDTESQPGNNSGSTDEGNDKEMLQAFDDFEKEFGVDEDSNTISTGESSDKEKTSKDDDVITDVEGITSSASHPDKH